MIPYAKHPPIMDYDVRMVEKALCSEHLTKGPMLRQFEEEVAEFCGARYCVAMNSGTSALHAAVAAVENDKNEHVPWKVPAVTFRATQHAVVLGTFGAWPEVVDVDSTDGMVGDGMLGGGLALIPVSIGGRVPDTHWKHYVADYCHAFGTRGDAILPMIRCYSTHAIKSLSTGEGGLAVTDDQALAEYMQDFRDVGGGTVEGPNYRMTEMQAALGISRLKRVLSEKDEKRTYMELYRQLLHPVFPEVEDGVNYHLAQARIESGSAPIAEFLRECGIDARAPLYPPLASLPGALEFSRTQLVLPLWVGMGESTVRHVAYSVLRALEPVVVG